MVFSEVVKAPLRSILNEKQRRSVKSFFYAQVYRSNLSKMAILFRTDKQDSHYYAQHYQHHFGPLRQKKLNILEIGIGGYENPKAGGESLMM